MPTPPVFKIPPYPSLQLKVVLDYIDALESWDFDTLAKLTTPYFTQQSIPASLDQPLRNKTEDLEFLQSFKKSLNGVNLDIVIYNINESPGKIWVHMFINAIKMETIDFFDFGIGLDTNLLVHVTEFVDSNVFLHPSRNIRDDSSDGSSDCSSDGSSDA